MAGFNEVIYLITPIYTTDKFGVVKETIKEKKIFANRFSISFKESFMTAQSDLKPDISFQVRTAELENSKAFNYQGKRYEITRENNNGGDFSIIFGKVKNGKN